ncbi:hypothetical protein Geob_0154 [Geotalea daltonii FRC-32]|uniref:Uncharacterized protein n=1 Tax=Geotalea daltonii (strain DSM 22248 / JCM 15807 / FRC-32) TaxID=316067 RepID=B9M8J2_GEODF|nr:hypothetical protein [Geotalea daltonii]ACM18527.1 hypothetical protein Geob_0154 [Geotalea daltonii FRC-32]
MKILRLVLAMVFAGIILLFNNVEESTAGNIATYNCNIVDKDVQVKFRYMTLASKRILISTNKRSVEVNSDDSWATFYMLAHTDSTGLVEVQYEIGAWATYFEILSCAEVIYP